MPVGAPVVFHVQAPDRSTPMRPLRRRTRSGQAMVELSLLAGILAIILLGIIQLVLLYNARTNLSDAVRTGVRMAALSYTDSTIVSRTMQVIDAHGMNTAHSGVCDIQELDIYRANADGSVYAGPNNKDVYTYTYANGTCTPTLTYPGFPLSVRQSVSSPNAIPMNVGVQMFYRAYLQTPVLNSFGSYLTIKYDAVLALGEDNANDFLNLPSSTPVPTFTATNTPTITPTPSNTTIPTSTATSTGTATNTATSTPSSTPCLPLTPAGSAGCPFTVTPVKTATPTLTATPASTPTVTVTSTPTPLPSPGQVSYSVACLSGNQIAPPGIRLQWDPVPGATGYQLWFYDSSKGVPGPASESQVATLSGVSSTFYPVSSPPYYDVKMTTGSYWYVIATYGGSVVGAPGQSTPVATAQACDVPS